MKKLLALLVAGFMILSIFPAAALAVTEPVDDDQEVIEEVIEDVLTPDSPFYFLKRFKESIQTLLTFRTESKLALSERLAEERVKEYLALQAKYADGEISEQDFALLEKALDDIVVYYQRLIDLVEDQNDPGDEPIYDDDDDEDADDDEDGDDADDDQDEDADEDEDGEDADADDDGEDADDEEEGKEETGCKYEARIAHLEQIMAKVPETAHKGLSRAIDNARRQQARKAAETGSEDPGEVTEPGDDAESDDDEALEDNEDNEDDEGLEGQSGGKQKEEKLNNGKDKDKVPPGQMIRNKIRQVLPGKGRNK